MDIRLSNKEIVPQIGRVYLNYAGDWFIIDKDSSKCFNGSPVKILQRQKNGENFGKHW